MTSGLALGAASLLAKGAGFIKWAPWALAGVSLLAGTGGTVWYRMQWKDCQSEGAQALIDQHEIDRLDNIKSVGQLTTKLNTNEKAYDKALSVLQNIPKTQACIIDGRVRAARDELCAKYPKSETCSRSVAPR